MKRQDQLLAHMDAYAVDRETNALLLKYLGMTSESKIVKSKLMGIDEDTKALLIKLVNRIAADTISIADAGAHYTSENVEDALQEIGGKPGREATFSIAASDSSAKSKAQADYVCDGVADDVEIQAAIDAVKILGRGLIVLLEGNYFSSTSLTILCSNITLMGIGRGTKLRLANNVNKKMIYVGDNINTYKGIAIRDMELDGNAVNQGNVSCYGIQFDGGISESRIMNCWIHDTTDDAIKLGNEVAVTDRVVRNTIAFNYIWDIGKMGWVWVGDGIDLDFADDNIIIGNDIRTGFRTGTHDGIDLGNDSSRNIIGFNKAVNCGNYGMYGDDDNDHNFVYKNYVKNVSISGIAFMNSIGNRIEGNYVDESGHHGIAVATNAHKSIIIGNIVKNNGQDLAAQGIRVADAENCIVADNIVFDDQGIAIQDVGILLYRSPKIIVTGNIIFNNVNDGIVVSGTDCIGLILNDNTIYENGRHGMNLISSIDCIIENNIVFNNDAVGIYLNGVTHSIISGNNVFDDQVVAIQRWGIFEAGAADFNLIVNNKLRRNTTTQITPIGANTIVRNNMGFVTENSGTGTIVNPATAAVIAHGLDVTPTVDDIHITLAENPLVDIGYIWVDTIGAANFTVNCAVAPGGNDLDFGWQAIVL